MTPLQWFLLWIIPGLVMFAVDWHLHGEANRVKLGEQLAPHSQAVRFFMVAFILFGLCLSVLLWPLNLFLLWLRHRRKTDR